MKKLFVSTIIVIFSINPTYAQVKWFDDFESAQKNALETGRHVVVECYHPECQHCNDVNRYLETPYLFSYLNNNFSNFRINLTDIKQVEFLEKNNIRLTNFPMFLIFDEKGSFLNFIEPENSPASIRRQFEENKGVSLVGCESTQNAIIKDKVKCALFYKLKKDISKSNLAVNQLFAAMPEADKPTQISWILMKKLVLDTENEFFKYWFANREAVFKYEKEGSEMDPFAAILQAQSKALLATQAIIKKEDFENLNRNLSLIFNDPKRQFIWLWELEMAYFQQEKDYQGIKNICEKMITYYPEATTYTFLLEKILERNYDNGMFFYFSDIKDKWINGLKNQDQLKNAYVISSKYFGFNGKKIECEDSIQSAISHGLESNQAILLKETYCK